MDEAKYVNKFNVVANAEENEAIIYFYHLQPLVEQKTATITGTEIYGVSSLIMSLKTAKELCKILQDCITDSENKQNNPKE